jgi:carboxyl-terminal processing protease
MPRRAPFTRIFRAGLPALALAALAACAGSGAAPQTGPAAAPVDPALALATFDSAWSRINNSYYDPAFGGLDWKGVRDELRPRAEGARTLGELRGVLRDMLGRLGKSHFGVIPRESFDELDPASPSGSATPADAGLDVRWVEDAVVVTRVDADGPAARAGVRTGWMLESVGGREAGRWREALAAAGEAERKALRAQVVWSARSLFSGAPGDTVRARFRDGAGKIVDAALVLRPTPGEPVRFGNLPTMMASLEHRKVEQDGGCVGVIRFSAWMTAIDAHLERAVDELRGCRGMVVDLRGNPGGVAGMIMGASGFFLDRADSLGTMRTRASTLRFVANPRRATRDGRSVRPFAGPLALITDELTMSTSEFFAAGLRGVGRARVFGEVSGGQALPALMVRLPTGDVLLHVYADYTGPRGEPIEGRGVPADEAVPLKRADLLAGRDAPLEAAFRWIASAPAQAAGTR